MISVDLILSDAQNHIGDIDNQRIQENEWTSMATWAIQNLAEATHIFVSRIVVVPNPLAVFPAVQSSTPLYTVNIPEVNTLNGQGSPFKFLKVYRQNHDLTSWMECNEYSQQSINSTTSITDSFDVNRTLLGRNTFSSKHSSPADVTDGSITLTFAGALDISETIIIDYITNKPITIPMWIPGQTPALGIPEFMRNAVRYHVLTMACERLGTKGDQGLMQSAQLFRTLAEQETLKAASYAKLFKDNNSVIKVQPVNWLDEDL